MTYSLCKQIKPRIITPLRTLLTTKPAWAIYDAANFNISTQQLIDSSVNGRHATCTGCTLENGSGNGSTVTIPSVNGLTTSTILFPNGSIPTASFTIFALTRYTSASANGRILTGTGQGGAAGNFILGHWNGEYVRVYNFDNFLTAQVTLPKTNYCNVGFTSAAISPHNVMFEGLQTLGGANRSQTGVVTVPLSVNLFNPSGTVSERSDFALSQVIIWDVEMTIQEMRDISTSLTFYLNNGYY